MSSGTLRFLLMLTTAMSLLSLPGPISHTISILPRANAVGAGPFTWTPAGPTSNNLEIKIYGGAAAECADLFAAAPLIDALDGPACVPNPCAGPNYFLTTSGYCVTSYWNGIVDAGIGSPGTFNFFTTLNAYSDGTCIPVGCTLAPLPQSPPLGSPSAGNFRQGFSAPTTGLNPYSAVPSAQNMFILFNVYDTLYRLNPEAAAGTTELLGWMTPSFSVLNNAQLAYVPPAGTVASIRNFLRIDIFSQDGAKLDARDVAFTYLSLIASAAPQNPPQMVCPGPTCEVTGITLVNCALGQPCNEFDIHLSAMGPTTLEDIGSVTVLPGHIWSSCATTWASFLPATSPAVFPLGAIGPACAGGNFLAAAPALLAADPTLAVNPSNGKPGILIGAGPWSCQNTGSNAAVPVGSVGTGCSSSNNQSPPAGGSFFLTRFGCSLASSSCLTPAGSIVQYFRSSGNLALWFWVDVTTFLKFATFFGCYNRPVGTVGCTRWQEGIGNPNGPKMEGITQISLSLRFYVINWIAPFDWVTTPPAGIVSVTPVLYERTSAALIPAYTLNPKSVAGCVMAANGLPAAPAYPGGGGYDC